ncbi:MAG: type VI secretion system protein TssA [Acidobacteriota bacterium]|nr:type VI secretion system protein TssA [Acidobacteriota bacterium]
MPLRDDLLAPIPGNSPGGISLRYDPITDKIKEARREDVDAPQGAWKTAVKTADHAQVIKLASDAIATRSKDLQLAVWLVDSHVKREGFAVLPDCLRFLRNLQNQFWDALYPEISDGDLEMRAAPLEWLGSKLEDPLRMLPITSNGLGWVKFKESRSVGYETDANNEDKRKLRAKLIDDGKVTAEEYDQAMAETPKQFLEGLQSVLEQSLAELEELNNFCNDKYSDVAPSFLKTRAAIEEIAHTLGNAIAGKGGPAPANLPAAEPEPQPVAQTPAAPVPVSTPASPPPPPSASTAPSASPAGIEPVDLTDVAKRLAAIARFLRAKDKYDIAPYLILRGFRWGEIRYNGPEVDNKALLPPADEVRAELEQHSAANSWDKVLEVTEAAMETPCGRCWLDLQRHTVKALEAKGQWFAFVADAVRSGVRGLISDLPGLLNLSMRDGTPTADAQTREWIMQEVMAGVTVNMSAPGAPVPQPIPSAPAPAVQTAAPVVSPSIKLEEQPPPLEEEDLAEQTSSDVFDEAIQAARAGRPAEALDLISKKLATERSGRGRFRRRVQLAHLLMAGGREHIAHPILEQLTAEIEHRKLEEWELGEGLAYPVSLLLQCMTSNGGDAETRKQLYARLCRLDPVRALDSPH